MNKFAIPTPPLCALLKGYGLVNTFICFQGQRLKHVDNYVHVPSIITFSNSAFCHWSNFVSNFIRSEQQLLLNSINMLMW
jgi:hypothetical protein